MMVSGMALPKCLRAEVDHGEIDAALGAGPKHRGGRRQRPVPGLDVVLLRADVE